MSGRKWGLKPEIVVEDLSVQFPTNVLICVWLEIHSQIILLGVDRRYLPVSYNKVTWLMYQAIDFCDPQRDWEGPENSGTLKIQSLVFSMKLKRLGSNEEEESKRFMSCVYVSVCVSWGGVCGCLREPRPWSTFCNFFMSACVCRKLASWIKTTSVLFAHCPLYFWSCLWQETTSPMETGRQ